MRTQAWNDGLTIARTTNRFEGRMNRLMESKAPVFQLERTGDARFRSLLNRKWMNPRVVQTEPAADPEGETPAMPPIHFGYRLLLPLQRRKKRKILGNVKLPHPSFRMSVLACDEICSN